MVQGPLSRFGDTAANTGVLTLLDNLESTRDLNVGIKTVAASGSAALFRIFLMPIDTVKVSKYRNNKKSSGNGPCRKLNDLTLSPHVCLDNNASNRKILSCC